ncbi:MAG: hypothetical protein L6W00_12765 [Lentisphaeria bacterium]|nr:MAG: hypothetical protein L6W00_12765 [Lentisphaeria bacterium]
MAIDWLGAAIILTGFRNLQGTGGSIAYHSMRYFRVSENEYAQLSERSRTYAPWEQTVDGNGNTVYDLTIAGHQTEVGNYLEIRYNDQSDQLQNMNEARSVSLNPDVSQIDFIDSFIDASANYREIIGQNMMHVQIGMAMKTQVIAIPFNQCWNKLLAVLHLIFLTRPTVGIISCR